MPAVTIPNPDTDELDSGVQLEPGQPIPPDEPVTSAPLAPAPPPPAPMILRGPQGPQPTPSLMPVALPTQQQAATDEMLRRAQNVYATDPTAQTEAAVSAALRFQAQRQYQQDLASGVAPAEALAKAAPLLFAGPKMGNLGQAAAMVKATQRPVQKPIDVGGVLYRQNPDGSVTPLTPPKPTAPPRANQFDLAEHNSILTQIREVQKEAANDEIGSPEFQQHQTQLRVLQQQLEATRRRAPQGVTPPTRTATTRTGRVRVRSREGKYGSVPADQLETALQQGYTEVK